MVKRIIDDAQADGLDDYAALNYCDEAGYCKRVELRKTGVIWGQIWGQNHTWWQIWGSKMYVIVCYSPVGRLCKLLILM
jgi:hypothetical protein